MSSCGIIDDGVGGDDIDSSNDSRIFQKVDDTAKINNDNVQSDNITRRSLTRFVNARILQRDGSLVHGSMTVDPSSWLIVQIEAYCGEYGEEKKYEEEMNLQLSEKMSHCSAR